jgi:colanic acid biosynthesis glycosyl transferase WcaI
MRILVVSNLFSPDHAGGAAVYSDLCFELAARGHEVTIRCAYPYFPEWTDKSNENGFRRRRETIRGVSVERFGLYIPSDPTSVKQRAVYESSFFWSLSRSLHRSGGADVIVAFSTMLSPVAVAVAVGKLHRIPVLVNVQDVSSGGAAAASMLNGRSARMLARVERRILRGATELSSIAPEMVESLREATEGKVPVSYVPNWLNATLADAVNTLPPKLGRTPTHPLRLLYAGNIGNKQGLLEFCERARASSCNFRFTIHGSGPGADGVREWWEQHRDERFEFGPFLPEADFAKALHECDLFVITEREGSGNAYMPSKLIPAIASGTPVLAVCDDHSSLGSEVIRSGVGPHLRWDQLDLLPDVFASAMDAACFRKWQRRALDRSGAFERDNVIDIIEQDLLRLSS